MAKIKVAIVLPYFGKGGAESMVSRLAAHLDLSSVDVKVICIYGEPQNNSFERAVIDHGVEITYIGKGLGFSGKAIIELWKVLSAYNPDVIHTHLSACVYCSPWILFHKVKMLHTVHSMPSHELIKPKQIVMKYMYRSGKAIPVAISHEIKELIPNLYKPKYEPELIYNPVDIERFSIPKKPHDHYTVITVGRLSKEKNQILLVRAFHHLVERYFNMRLIIVGEGDERGEIERYIIDNDLKEKIMLTGNVDDVENYLANADVFVLTSIYEGLPLVILEAMASSLPIISTNVGGVKDVVTNNGILINSGNEKELEYAIAEMYNDSELAISYANHSWSNVQSFDSKKIGEEYVRLYRKYRRKRK